jgi:polygalacturonase
MEEPNMCEQMIRDSEGSIRILNRIRPNKLCFLPGFLALLIVIQIARAAQSSGSMNVLDHGAIGDGKTLCTNSIQAAVDACSAAGGGIVDFPAGRYLSGPIFLKSNVTLHIGEGARLLASNRFDDFPLFKPGWSTKGNDQKLAGLITGVDLENVAITGRGTIDGQGQPWWEAQNKDKKATEGQKKLLVHGRPHLISLYRCRNVRIAEVTVVNSPSWNVHLVGCENLVVDGIAIINPAKSPNTDGINPESCRNVRIANCFIDTGDDCITLKSGQDEEGRAKALPTENVAITNCVMYHGHGAVVIGSEMSGGVRNVAASNIVCYGTDTGVRIKSTRGRGGVVENIRFDNWIMDNVLTPISITNFYTKTAPEPVSERTPVFREIAISHLTISNSPCVAKILGLPEMPIQALRISDVTASTRQGFQCERVDDLELQDIRIDASEGSAFNIANCRNMDIQGLQCPKPVAGKAIVCLENSQDAFIHGCRAWPGTEIFLEIRGAESKGISLQANRLSTAGRPFITKQSAPDNAVSEK